MAVASRSARAAARPRVLCWSASLALSLPVAALGAELAAPGDCAETSPDLVTPPVQAQPQGVPSSPAEHFSPIDVALDVVGSLQLDPSIGPVADLPDGPRPDRPSLDPVGNPVADLTRRPPEPSGPPFAPGPGLPTEPGPPADPGLPTEPTPPTDPGPPANPELPTPEGITP